MNEPIQIQPNDRVHRSISNPPNFSGLAAVVFLLFFFYVVYKAITNLEKIGTIINAVFEEAPIFSTFVLIIFFLFLLASVASLVDFYTQTKERRKYLNLLTKEKEFFGVQKSWPFVFIIHSDKDELSLIVYDKLIRSLYKKKIRVILYSDFEWYTHRTVDRVIIDRGSAPVTTVDENPQVALMGNLIIFLQCSVRTKGMMMEYDVIKYSDRQVICVLMPDVKSHLSFKRLIKIVKINSDSNNIINFKVEEIAKLVAKVL